MRLSNKKEKVIIVILCTVGLLPDGGRPVLAQEGANDVIDEIIVTGTRRLGRTVANAPVPVDVFQGEELENMGTGDMDDILRTLVPSYNVQRFPLDDEESLVRPATLRGLPPDNTLTLINGKRRHRSGVLTGGGSQGGDMSVIPSIALQHLEVLRDGASAQYGSDAVAGVLNFITRTNNDGLILEYKMGEYFEGDGQNRQVGINKGFSLGGDGFINLSLEYGDRDRTSRAEQRTDAQALIDLGHPNVPVPAQNYGQPSIDDELKTFVSGAFNISPTAELYGFGNYADRFVLSEFFWRNPNSWGGVFTSGDERLVFDLTPDNSGNCPVAGSPGAIIRPPIFTPTQQDYDNDIAALAALAADPNCWVVNEMYPSGYRPDFGADITDWSTVFGIRGERNDTLRYDVSLARGTSKANYHISNTLNPSLGPTSPTSFSPGRMQQSETNFNVDLAWPVDFGTLYSPLNVAIGFEYRDESFKITPGDEASWTVGPLQAQGSSIGSHGYPGFSPINAGEWSRSNTAFYVDLEADITERFLLGIAARYEDFDDFGSTTNAKAAFRFMFNNSIAMRGSVGTGFRAPTPAQSNATKTSLFTFQGQVVEGGLIPPTNPIAEFYGGMPLTPEESDSISIGLTIEPIDALTVTIDYFRVDLDDRISVGPSRALSQADRDALALLGVPGGDSFRFINFFGNDTNTRTKGFDLVATYDLNWDNGSISTATLAWNQTKTDVRFMDNPSRDFIVDLQERPEHRGIITFNHFWDNFRFLVRASYYDDWVDSGSGFAVDETTPVCTTERPPNPSGTDECYGDEWLVDIELAYTFKNQYSLIVGADNIFDTVPDVDFDYPGFATGAKYPRPSPIGYHGGYWYARLRAEF